MSPARLPDWSARLDAYLAPLRRMPHHWAEHNCGRFCGGALAAMTGADPAADLWGGIASEADALALLAGQGGMEALVTRYLGQPLDSVLHASRGDVVMAPVAEAGADAIGLCNGADCIFVGPRGLSRVPLSACTRAWHIPAPEFKRLHREVFTHGR